MDVQCRSVIDRYFNSQPHEEADVNAVKEMSIDDNFNSQPHEEADPHGRYATNTQGISTHSLTRRLTRIWLRRWEFKIFQLTASRGG